MLVAVIAIRGLGYVDPLYELELSRHTGASSVEQSRVIRGDDRGIRIHLEDCVVVQSRGQCSSETFLVCQAVVPSTSSRVRVRWRLSGLSDMVQNLPVS